MTDNYGGKAVAAYHKVGSVAPAEKKRPEKARPACLSCQSKMNDVYRTKEWLSPTRKMPL